MARKSRTRVPSRHSTCIRRHLAVKQAQFDSTSQARPSQHSKNAHTATLAPRRPSRRIPSAVVPSGGVEQPIEVLDEEEEEDEDIALSIIDDDAVEAMQLEE